jgi:hypothetical protein
MVELVRSGRNPEEEFDARLSETGHCVNARVAAMGFPVSWETLQEEGERVNHKRVAPLAPAYLSRLGQATARAFGACSARVAEAHEFQSDLRGSLGPAHLYPGVRCGRPPETVGPFETADELITGPTKPSPSLTSSALLRPRWRSI